MFIYKITVSPINKSYIGLDTKESYKLARWNIHCNICKKSQNTKLYKAMSEYGIENCKIEILHDNVQTIGELALLEIKYIKKYDTFKNGLNSTPGGDGLNIKNLSQITEIELSKIKKALGENLSNYNKNIKWFNKTKKERKNLTSHLHTEEIYKKKSNTLKRRYEKFPHEKKEKFNAIDKWRKENYNKLCEQNRKASIAAKEINCKKIKVEHPDGTIKIYESKTEFHRCTNQFAAYIIKKTKEGTSHNGYRIWEI